jgi:hypothetical protein
MDPTDEQYPAEPDKKPTNVAELYADDEPAEKLTEEPGPASPLELKADEDDAPAEEGAIPLWAQDHLPPGLKIPRGRQVTFMRFRSAWTDAPDKGVMTTFKEGPKGGPYVGKEVLSRVLVLWPLGLAEATQARRRAKSAKETLEELTKQMIRSCDGKRVDWSGSWAKDEMLVDANGVWRELGLKVHPFVTNAYLKMHTLSDEQFADFYLNCIASASAVAG